MTKLYPRASGKGQLVHAACALILFATAPATILAQEPDPKLPIFVYADSFDGEGSTIVYEGLRLTQGGIRIQADEGRTTNFEFEDSVWHFSGNVVIDAQQGHVECATADLRFADGQLQTAHVTGAPATFELRRPGSEVVTHAQAHNLVYDFLENVVEFSGDVTITEGGNRISSEYLVYNIAEQRIKAQPGGKGKVRIKYTPSDSDGPESGDGDPENAGGAADEPENEAADK